MCVHITCKHTDVWKYVYIPVCTRICVICVHRYVYSSLTFHRAHTWLLVINSLRCTTGGSHTLLSQSFGRRFVGITSIKKYLIIFSKISRFDIFSSSLLHNSSGKYKHIYSSTVFKYNFEVLKLYLNFLVLNTSTPLHNISFFFTPLHLFTAGVTLQVKE